MNSSSLRQWFRLRLWLRYHSLLLRISVKNLQGRTHRPMVFAICILVRKERNTTGEEGGYFVVDLKMKLT